MMHFTVSVDRQTGAVEIDTPASNHPTMAASQWRRGSWVVFCWGDPAQASTDSDLVRAATSGQTTQQWGRSWIAVNMQRALIRASVDRLGVFPLWTIETPTQVIATTHRHNLLKRQLVEARSPQAMQTLVTLGQLFDSQTIWQGTDILTAGAQLSITSRGITKSSQLSEPVLGNWQTRFDDALDAFVESMRTCLNAAPDALVSLSGGLDSRLILAAAQALGKPVTGLTYGQPDSGDVQIARQLAEATNTPLFTGQTPERQWAWSILKRVAELGAGETPLHHAHAILDPALLEQTRGRTLITGTGAETSRAFYYDRGMPGYGLLGQSYLGRSTLMEKAQRYIRQEYWKSAGPFVEHFPEIESRLNALLDKKLQEHENYFHKPSLYLDNFYLQNRVTRMVASGQQLLDEHYQRSHPFLDKDTLFYMAHLPVRYKLGSTFHRKAIAKLAPNLAEIRWDKTNMPLAQGMPWPVRYPALAARIGKSEWGKQAKGMFDYQDLLSIIPDSVLLRSLEEMHCSVNSLSAKQLHALRQHLAFTGYSAVWSHLARPVTELKLQSA